MNAIFTLLLIICNHVAHGLYNPYLIPVLTLLLGVWSVHRILSLSTEPTSLTLSVLPYLPVAYLICMLLKPGGVVIKLTPPGPGNFFRILYLATLCPVWVRQFSLKQKTTFLAIGAFVYFTLALILDPSPGIDVMVANNMGLDYLSQGLNPYSQFYPDILSGGRGYQPGFLYWPGTLYLEGLSRFLFGDIRVVLALLWWSSPFFFSKSASPQKDLLVKVAWWFLPCLNFCIQCAWIDPILAFCASLLIFGITRRKGWVSSFAIALAASTKQYGCLLGIFAIPYLFLTEPKKSEVIKVIFYSAGIFTLLLLPFVVWNFHDFINMTVLSHLQAETRLDALSFTAWWIRVVGQDFSARAQAVMTLSGFVLALIHVVRNSRKRGVRTLPEAWAIAFGFSVMFGKFAFANYYWLWISFMILVLALEQLVGASSQI